MEKYKILSVKIVAGKTLKPEWNSNMQIIKTDKGEFIDNLPGKQHGFFKTAAPGFNWEPHIGKIVDGIRIFDYSGYKWLNKHN